MIQFYRLHNNQLIIINKYKCLGKAASESMQAYDGAICYETASHPLRRAVYVLITIYSSVSTSAASEQRIRTLSGSLMPVIDRLISGPRALSSDNAGMHQT